MQADHNLTVICDISMLARPHVWTVDTTLYVDLDVMTMAGMPVPAELFDDDPTWSALEEVARIPQAEIDKIIEKLGLGDFLRAARRPT